MYPIKKRPKQGFTTYKCFHCKRKEKRYTKNNPWNAQPEPAPIEPEAPDTVKSLIIEEISEVLYELVHDEHYLKKLEEEYID